MSKELIEEIVALLEISKYGDSYNDLEDIEGIEIVEEDDWTQEHKYQYKDTYFKYKDHFFCLSESRSGSYHTDWYYNEPDVYEVKRITKVVETTVWKKV
jgi:hypothetical protein